MTAPRFQIHFVDATVGVAHSCAVRTGKLLEMKRNEPLASGFDRYRKVVPGRSFAATRVLARRNAAPDVGRKGFDVLGRQWIF